MSETWKPRGILNHLDYVEIFEDMKTEIAELKTELAEAREDTARLDWLANPMGASFADYQCIMTHTGDAKEFREFIDAARK